ncbi:MFS transporter [Rhodobacteraceae bacterium 2CG4]|uniref:MFS transporter n=1 Tax=Halovulum marinum TaxID=2662447 RepID=A0A6L5Z184_9RHOB|nr:MFS transporter [Halovulum marinum]MSU90333.1 MFS transporter [Halovulum marinum]
MTPTIAGGGAGTAGRAPLIVGSLAHAANDAYAGFLPALLPVYYLHLGLDEAALAFLVAIFAISASLPGPLLGLLADRVGARTVAAFSVALSALLMSPRAMAPQPAYLFALTAAAELGSAAIHPSGSLLVRRGRVTPERAVALFSAAGMLGYAAGPVLPGAARAQSGSLLPVVLAAPGLLAALAILALLPREKKPAPAKGAPAPRFENSLIAGRVGLLTLAAAFAFLPATAMLNGLPLLLVERHNLDRPSRCWAARSASIRWRPRWAASASGCWPRGCRAGLCLRRSWSAAFRFRSRCCSRCRAGSRSPSCCPWPGCWAMPPRR